MSEPIVTRLQIARQAEEAARVAVTLDCDVDNPYPVGSDAAAAFDAALSRYVHAYAAPESEASA